MGHILDFNQNTRFTAGCVARYKGGIAVVKEVLPRGRRIITYEHYDTEGGHSVSELNVKLTDLYESSPFSEYDFDYSDPSKLTLTQKLILLQSKKKVVSLDEARNSRKDAR